VPHRIWKLIAGTWYGRANGHKVVIYEGTEPVLVFVYKGDIEIKSTHLPTVKAAKVWGEKHYLKVSK
jgi:hypothetical protein